MLRNPDLDPDRMKQRRVSAKKDSTETIAREQAEAQNIDEDREQKIKDLLESPLASALFEALEYHWRHSWKAFRYAHPSGDEFIYRQGHLDSAEAMVGYLFGLAGRKPEFNVELKIVEE